MIHIELIIDELENIKKLKVKGHSNFNIKGNDIVCAAVSVLVETAYISLYALFKSVNRESEIEYRNNNDFYFCIKSISEQIKKEIKGITLFLITGLKEIEKKYNNHIKFDIKRS